MTADDIQKLLHILKPQGHGNSQFSTDLHAMANHIQWVFDLCFTALTEVTKPSYKGEVKGELMPWDKHHPLMLDHTGTALHGIYAGNADVGEWVSHLWEEACDYLTERYGEPASEHTTRVVRQMDKNDLRAELAA